MYFYKLNNNYIISMMKEEKLTEIMNRHSIPNSCNLEPKVVSESEIEGTKAIIFAANYIEPGISRMSHIVSHSSQLFNNDESIDFINPPSIDSVLPKWLDCAITEKRVISLNMAYPNWYEVINKTVSCQSKEDNTKWRINIVGLGDVGGTLATGLRLVGGDCISTIGLYDKDLNKTNRWYYECSQILSSDYNESFPEILTLNEQELFNCDMFVFCVSVGVPEVGKEKQDVRLVQFQGNSKIISHYAKMARKNNYKGIFAVVSDPVDLLCKVAFDESNKNDNGVLDYKGLGTEQIRGYGLGVMNARAAFFSKRSEATAHYIKEGRAFGPHGEGLIIADSINNYNPELSHKLTNLTKTANLQVRESGFKPFVAPALSSGTLSLISTIKGKWHYSATFLGGIFFGCNNRMLRHTTELETYKLPEPLLVSLKVTYEFLLKTYNEQTNKFS